MLDNASHWRWRWRWRLSNNYLAVREGREATGGSVLSVEASWGREELTAPLGERNINNITGTLPLSTLSSRPSHSPLFDLTEMIGSSDW